MSTAVLIDGGFFLKRLHSIYGAQRTRDAEFVANTAFTIALRHIGKENQLYRIFYYDCSPYEKKQENPISGAGIDFSNTPQAQFRRELHNELKKKRKTALRLGYLVEGGRWQLKPDKLKALLRKEITVDDIQENDIYFDLKQKWVDIKIGIDIASLAYKKQVNQIILIAGDSDFVPAAKLARREGIDFILDPMWYDIHESLFEHIDGLQSVVKNPDRADNEYNNYSDDDSSEGNGYRGNGYSSSRRPSRYHSQEY